MTSLELHGICETPNHQSVWTGIPYMLWNVLFCGVTAFVQPREAMLPARPDADHDFYLSKVSYLGANLVRFISLSPMAPIIGFEILLNLPITRLDRTYTEDLTDVRFCLYNAIANS